MVNTTITSLVEKTTPATTDVIPIVDIAGGTVTKKITIANFKTAIIDPAITTAVGTEATTRADEDGFLYVDSSNLSTSSATFVTLRTYTINKACDALILTQFLRNSAASNSVMGFFKNGAQLGAEVILLSGGSYSTSYVGYLDTSGQLTSSINITSNFKVAMSVLINTSFAIGDTLVLKMLASGGTAYSDFRTLQGVKNKSTDTTWVSVS